MCFLGQFAALRFNSNHHSPSILIWRQSEFVDCQRGVGRYGFVIGLVGLGDGVEDKSGDGDGWMVIGVWREAVTGEGLLFFFTQLTEWRRRAYVILKT